MWWLSLLVLLLAHRISQQTFIKCLCVLESVLATGVTKLKKKPQGAYFLLGKEGWMGDLKEEIKA